MNKIKKLGLVGLLALGSCKGMEDDELAALGFIGDLAGVSPASSAAEAATGIAVGRAADRESGRREAREGKTEVNVYGDGGNGNRNNLKVYEQYRSAGKEIPDNVIWVKREGDSGFWRPAEGYVFNDPKNIFAGVRRVPEELVVKHYKDDNKNGEPEKEEILGKVNGPVNLDEFGLIVYLNTLRSGDITYVVRDEDGNKVGSTIRENTTHYNFFTNSTIFSGDFMDNLNGHSRENPGKFTFYVSQEGLDEIFTKEVIITRNQVD